MTDIRPIVQREAAEFLSLLCNVFELDFKRAEGVFFSEPLFEIDRKWGLFVDGRLATILTTVGLEFGWGRAIGIAGVATRRDVRGSGLASRLLEEVLSHAERSGEGPAMLFAADPRLYERLGFERIDWVVRGGLAGLREVEQPPILDHDAIKTLYDRWAADSPDRLRRDDRRWAYWQWSLRTCVPIPKGYVCFEGDMIREMFGEVEQAPIGDRCEWFGLESMLAVLGIQLKSTKREIALMGRNVPGSPQMFLTDQF